MRTKSDAGSARGKWRLLGRRGGAGGERARLPDATCWKSGWFERLEQRSLLSVTAIGSALQIDSGTPPVNVEPQIATDAAGDMVVAWATETNNVFTGDLYFRVFGANGTPLTGQTLINAGHAVTTDIAGGGTNNGALSSENPKFFGVAMDAAGDFVVAWQTAGGIDAQRFNLAGAANGSLVSVTNAGGSANATSTSVAMDAAGDFTVAWLSDESVALKTQSMTPAISTQEFYNGHVVTHANAAQVTYGNATYKSSVVYARRFDAAGSGAATLRVTPPAPAVPGNGASQLFSSSLSPSVAMDTAGDFVVVWETNAYSPVKKKLYPGYSYNYPYYVENPSGNGGHNINLKTTHGTTYSYDMTHKSANVQFQRFDAGSNANGATLLVMSKTPALDAVDVQVAMDGAGDFAVVANFQYNNNTHTRDSYGYDVTHYKTSSSLRMKRFTAAGVVASAEVVVSSVGVITGEDAAIEDITTAVAGDGTLLVAWDKLVYDKQAYGTDEVGVFGRRFDGQGKALDAEFQLSGPGSDALDFPAAAFAGSQIDLAYEGAGSGTTDIFIQKYRQPKPDLTASLGVGTLPPALVAPTASVVGTIPLTITNIGDLGASGQVTVALVFSTDETFGNGDDQVVTLACNTFTISTAANGGTATVNLTATLPAGLSVGSNFLLARVTAGGTISELNANNNDAETGLLVANAAVNDLGISAVTTKLPVGPLVPGDVGTATVEIRNLGTTAVAGAAVTVNLFASTTGLLDGSEVALPGGSGSTTLTLQPGGVGKLTLPVAITQALASANWHIVAQIVHADDIDADNVKATVATPVVWEFGNVAGRKGLTKFTSKSGSKTIVYSLSGPGIGTVIDPVIADSVAITGSTAKTAVSIKVTGGDKTWALDTLTTDAALKSFTAPGVALFHQATFEGGLTSLTLGDMTHGGEIDIQDSVSQSTVNITLGRVSDLTLNVDRPIGTLSVIDWQAPDAHENVITGLTIGTLKTTGNKTGVAGDFGADLHLDGPANPSAKTLGAVSIAGAIAGGTWETGQGNIGTFKAKSAAAGWDLEAASSAVGAMTFTGNLSGTIHVAKLASLSVQGDMNALDLNLEGTDSINPINLLPMLTVKGKMLGSDIFAAGNIGAVTAGEILDSNIFAGTGVALPTGSGDFTELDSITSVKVKGIAGDATAFAGSSIAAAQVGGLSLGALATANGATAFGVVALAGGAGTGKPFSTISFSIGGVSTTLTPATVAGSPFTAGDFEVVLF